MRLRTSSSPTPIRFTRQQVALMVRVAAHLTPAAFARRIREPQHSLDCLALAIEQRHAPKAAILRYFHLQKDGEGFVWNAL